MMHWFGALYLRLHGINNGPGSESLHFIFDTLGIPLFKASHFFFKLSYALNQRRLRLLCGEDLFLKFYDRRISDGGIIDILQSLRRIVQGLEYAKSSQEIGGHVNS
jgi:hypothetical protein